jgi:hypothetical protein
MIGLNNIKFKQKNVLLLTDIFNGKKILKANSPKSKNIGLLKNLKINNNKNTNENTHTITQEKEKNEDICFTEKLERIKESNQAKDITNNKNSNIKCNKNKENINKDNLIISKKKNSHNNINSINPTFKQLKLEKSYYEKSKNKFDNNNIPLINKVHILEIGKTKISKNNNEEENNNLLKNKIFSNSDKKNSNNNIINNINEFTPKKNIFKNEFKNKIKYKQNKIAKEHLENSDTQINQKHY